MPEKRRKYDREFRGGAVRIVEGTGKSIARVARDLGVNEGILAFFDRPGRSDLLIIRLGGEFVTMFPGGSTKAWFKNAKVFPR